MGFEPTIFPVTGERPLRAGLRRRISCRGGSRTHDDRLIRAVPCRLATPQSGVPSSRFPESQVEARRVQHAFQRSLWNLEPGTWNLEPGTWNLEPGTWNLELQTKLAELSKITVPRAGVEPDLGGLKDRRPHRKSNGARTKNGTGRGSLLPPAGACSATGAWGYPLVSRPRPLIPASTARRRLFAATAMVARRSS